MGSNSKQQKKTGCIVLSDGQVFFGNGYGAIGTKIAELCFNTSMTGYQEVITDPSYAGQAIVFTFPHVGNTGVNFEDNEAKSPVAEGIITRWHPTKASNWRMKNELADWLKSHSRIGISEIDTRALTTYIRENGAPNASISYDPNGEFNIEDLKIKAQNWPGLTGLDLAATLSCKQNYDWNETKWSYPQGYEKTSRKGKKVIVVDFGAKRNILRCLTAVGCDIIVVPAQTSFAEIVSHNPLGVFLSNGPGDPEATARYTSPVISKLIKKTNLPIFGVCLGHQLLALALGAETEKMNFGHHGANHPVKNLASGKVEITSMNHGFAVKSGSLPIGVVETHISLFDGSNCGLTILNRNIFSVQYHPEASPGPLDSFHLFQKFYDML